VQGFLLGTQISMRMCAFYSKGNLSRQPSTILHILPKHTGSSPSMSTMHKAAIQGFVRCAVVVMCAIRPHRNQKNGNTMVMIVAGNLRDEDLIVRSDHYIMRQQYRPGDMVVMVSHLFMYRIGLFTD
jgi:hypothetical protein